MSESFAERGSKLLADAWTRALKLSGNSFYSPSLAAACDAVFAGSETGYQKAIVIQATGKASDPRLDAHAMQKGTAGEGYWDAREFAKQVFVPWNRDVGSPFTHAADPYVSNPYRVPRFDASVRSQRKKPREFDNALAVLDDLDKATTNEQAFNNLIEVVFALRRFVADRSVDYPLPSRASLSSTLDCVEGFVSEKSGGARLQAVVFALFSALSEQGMRYIDIASRHVNASDTSSESAGDVSFSINDASAAIEVKDRSLSRAELNATVDKCRIARVSEVLFVIRGNRLFAADLSDQDFTAERDRQFSSGLNIYVEYFHDLSRVVLALLGENGRRYFLEAVGMALKAQNADITHKWAWAGAVKEM